ncbi:MAG: DUF2807 domain-containing protein [Weeksellaceae bacterium]|nr:DUF2807 domain-containing protein [Weeksellaceae bacterium]
MKTKLLSLIVLISISLFSCVKSKDGSGKDFLFSDLISDSGKGEMTEKSYNLNFDELEISTSLKAEVFKSDQEKIVVYAPSDLMKYVVVKQNGQAVQVKIDNTNFKNISTDRIKIKVYAKDFDHLTANSSGNINLKGQFAPADLDVKVSSSGTVKGNIDGGNINIQTSSSGNYEGEIHAKSLTMQSSSSSGIDIKGKSESVDVQASSSSDVNAENFTAESAILASSSSAGISIGVSKSVTANASSSGGIEIIKRGSLAEIIKNESSSGTVSIR